MIFFLLLRPKVWLVCMKSSSCCLVEVIVPDSDHRLLTSCFCLETQEHQCKCCSDTYSSFNGVICSFQWCCQGASPSATLREGELGHHRTSNDRFNVSKATLDELLPAGSAAPPPRLTDSSPLLLFLTNFSCLCCLVPVLHLHCKYC